MVELGGASLYFLKLQNTEIDPTSIHFMVSKLGRWG